MRRALFVFLIVSLVELALERYRIYLLFSTAGLAGVVCSAFISRRRPHNALRIRTAMPKEALSEAASAFGSTEQGSAT
jgi:hypothetical protein